MENRKGEREEKETFMVEEDILETRDSCEKEYDIGNG